MAPQNNGGITVPFNGKDQHYLMLAMGALQAALAVTKFTSSSPSGSYAGSYDIFLIASQSSLAIFFILAGLFHERTVHIGHDGLTLGGSMLSKHRSKKIPKDQIVAIDELKDKFLIFHRKRPGQWDSQLHITKKKLAPQELDSLRHALRPLAPSEARITPMD